MVAIIMGAVLLAEKLTGVFVIGFVAVVVGVLFVNWPKRIEPE
jgi:drug/metabolite transporter (DMT)-like permease